MPDFIDDTTKLVALCEFYYANLTEYPAIELNDRQYAGTEQIDDKSLRRHLKWMAKRCLDTFLHPKTFDLRKAATWVGYIQGELRARGVFSISQLREQTRNAGTDKPLSWWATPPVTNAYGPLEDVQ